MTPEEKLRDLGITLPTPPAAVAAYEPWVRTGNQVVTSGQLPWDGDRLTCTGKLGAEVSEQEGYQAARRCAVNAIAQLKAAVGDLSQLRIVRLEGNVHSAAGFRAHPQVLNGASELFNEVFGERGRHTRTALGINEMPLDAPVQLSVYAEVLPAAAPGPGLSTALAHITLAVRDVSQAREFFQATLRWPPVERPGNIGRAAAWLQIGPQQELHLLRVPDFKPSPFEREFGRHVAITCPLAEFPALKARLVEHGAELIAPERATPFERFFFRTPDGYVFEVIQADHAPETGG